MSLKGRSRPGQPTGFSRLVIEYVVKLLFLSLASPEEAMARVAMRVRQGGHSIPPETIR